MRERPILFSGPMVRALLDGRKTQTRRVVKFPGTPPSDAEAKRLHLAGFMHETGFDGVRCPYGMPGDRLWVRETFAHDDSMNPEVLYRATWKCNHDFPGVPCEHGPDRWRPSIYMPRWASRITLEVTGVRVERLQAISDEDAKAEGVTVPPPIREEWQAVRTSLSTGLGELMSFEKKPSQALVDELGLRDVRYFPSKPLQTACQAFRTLWESINGADSWDANPWVWCVSFKRVTP